MDERPATDFTAGAIKITGRDMDIVTKEDGFIGIQTPDGREALVRTASMQILETGELVDVKGNAVLSEGGSPISVPPVKTMTIGDDGTISIVPADSPSNQLVVLDRIRLVTPNIADLEKGLDGYTRLKEGVAPLEPAPVTVVSGALESSNVNTAEALVNMIELSRKYELQVKMMNITKTHAQKSDSMLSMR